MSVKCRSVGATRRSTRKHGRVVLAWRVASNRLAVRGFRRLAVAPCWFCGDPRVASTNAETRGELRGAALPAPRGFMKPVCARQQQPAPSPAVTRRSRSLPLPGGYPGGYAAVQLARTQWLALFVLYARRYRASVMAGGRSHGRASGRASGRRACVRPSLRSPARSARPRVEWSPIGWRARARARAACVRPPVAPLVDLSKEQERHCTLAIELEPGRRRRASKPSRRRSKQLQNRCPLPLR